MSSLSLAEVTSLREKEAILDHISTLMTPMADRPYLSPLALSPAAQPKQLYHAAPLAIHDSVLEHGLDPTRFPRERWDASDRGVWCFETLQRAVEYAQSRSLGPLSEPYEIWEVQVEGLEMTRPWYDPESDLPAGIDVWWLTEAVPPERTRSIALSEPAGLEL